MLCGLDTADLVGDCYKVLLDVVVLAIASDRFVLAHTDQGLIRESCDCDDVVGVTCC